MLCGNCINSEEHKKRWLSLLTGDKQTLLVRDVCVRPRCPRLQLCGHLCVIHKLELELSWQGNYRVRACHGCRVSTLQLYRKSYNVWFVLEPSRYAISAHGVERRVMIPSTTVTGTFKTLVRSGVSGMRPFRKRHSLRRKSSRFINQHVRKEQMLALEWSLGNLPLEKCKHLWKDNNKRVETEEKSEICFAAMKLPAIEAHDANARAEPLDIFCVTLGCTRYAKTGNRCRFHSSEPSH